ncbi:MAG: tagaturonate reductase [Lachnospiraceae bacterium]|nr:tagaturonate reductase [Lachnospiraceae bacterium]
MERLTKKVVPKSHRPIRIVQFGEGNFLRGFVDYMIDVANEQGIFDGNIVMVKPRDTEGLGKFHEQDCQYTVSLRGNVDGVGCISNRIVTCVSDAVNPYREYEKYMKLAELETLRFVVSNTTEAGIVLDESDCMENTPPESFPGKLAQFLYHRFKAFNGDVSKGLIILPVELIDDNGIVLKKYVKHLAALWQLEEAFLTWLDQACVFTSTLVDRIITGYPGAKEEQEWEQLGYEDRLLVTGEPFGLWVIESEADISGELSLDKAGLPVIFTDNQKPYKQRKVRILNGAHTSFVPAAFLAGLDIVRDSMQDDLIREFMLKTIYQEVIPTLSLPEEELKAFAGEVVNRFNNPYVDHALLAIALNSVSKWRARCMPGLLGYVERFDRLPVNLTFSLAALMAFYSGTEIRDRALIGHRGEQEYKIMDDLPVLEFFRDHCRLDAEQFVTAFLGREDFFGQDLNQVKGLSVAVTDYLRDIRRNGMRAALCRIS